MVQWAVLDPCDFCIASTKVIFVQLFHDVSWNIQNAWRQSGRMGIHVYAADGVKGCNHTREQASDIHGFSQMNFVSKVEEEYAVILCELFTLE